MFCSNCGKKNRDGVKFCSSCGTEVIEAIFKKNNHADLVTDVSRIKCGNCAYIGPGEPARRKAFSILAWVIIPVAPLLTLIYFIATHKYRCPKCQSTFLGVQNKQGVFVGQKGGAMRPLSIIIGLFVGIAVIGVLASIVLASLNSARQKSRDARRITDIKEIQSALGLYHDANNSIYPSSLSFLVPNFMASIPNDPYDPSENHSTYSYYQCSPDSYHLGTSLEQKHPVLSGDKDIESMCLGDTINGLDSGKCDSSDTGLYCYDVGINPND